MIVIQDNGVLLRDDTQSFYIYTVYIYRSMSLRTSCDSNGCAFGDVVLVRVRDLRTPQARGERRTAVVAEQV